MLFAALTYAVTHSARTGSADLSEDKADIAAAEIVEHLATIREAINRLKMVNHCEDEQISFSTPILSMPNPNSPADYSCHVFYPQGGNVAQLTFNTDYFDPAAFEVGKSYITWNADRNYDYRISFNAANRWKNVGTHDNGVDSVDLIGQLYGVNDSVCAAINRRAGVTNFSINIYGLFGFFGSFLDNSDFAPSVTYVGAICFHHPGVYDANFVVYPLIER